MKKLAYLIIDVTELQLLCEDGVSVAYFELMRTNLQREQYKHHQRESAMRNSIQPERERERRNLNNGKHWLIGFE